jgi:hypothetical protein
MCGALRILVKKLVKLGRNGERQRPQPKQQHQNDNGKSAILALSLRLYPSLHASIMKHHISLSASANIYPKSSSRSIRPLASSPFPRSLHLFALCPLPFAIVFPRPPASPH